MKYGTQKKNSETGRSRASRRRWVRSSVFQFTGLESEILSRNPSLQLVLGLRTWSKRKYHQHRTHFHWLLSSREGFSPQEENRRSIVSSTPAWFGSERLIWIKRMSSINRKQEHKNEIQSQYSLNRQRKVQVTIRINLALFHWSSQFIQPFVWKSALN